MTHPLSLPFPTRPTLGPVLYLHSWGWIAARHRDGMWPPSDYSGRAYTIMASPRDFETGDGAVVALVPQGEEARLSRALVELRRSGMPLDTDHAVQLHDRYRKALDARWSRLDLAPGALVAETPTGPVPVQTGDVLACACSADEARAGRCHRTHAAPWLRVAGWAVREG